VNFERVHILCVSIDDASSTRQALRQSKCYMGGAGAVEFKMRDGQKGRRVQHDSSWNIRMESEGRSEYEAKR
jgi:hypothetical protein